MEAEVSLCNECSSSYKEGPPFSGRCSIVCLFLFAFLRVQPALRVPLGDGESVTDSAETGGREDGDGVRRKGQLSNG